LLHLLPIVVLAVAWPPLAAATHTSTAASDSVVTPRAEPQTGTFSPTAGAPERRLRLQEVRVMPPGETAKAVVRMIPLRPGAPIDPQVLIDTRQQLEASDVFERVELYTERGDAPGTVILHVEAELSRGFHLETGLGRELMQGWYLNMIGARYASPFRRGGYIRLGMHTAYRHAGTYIDAEYPRLLGKNYDLLMEIDHETETWPITEPDVTWHQNITRTRVHFGLRRWSREQALVTVWAGYSWADPSGTMSDTGDIFEDEPVGRLVPEDDGKHHYLDLRVGMSWDRRDATAAWRRGWWTGLQFEASSLIDGRAFWGVEADAHLALPVGQISGLAMRLRSAYASYHTPYHLRPIGGGVGALRGFETGSLSGPLGARGLVQGSLEWREPVLGRHKHNPDVITTLFLDLGEHWTDGHDLAGLSASVGYGMLIRIPWIQTLNAEVAFPLTDNPTDDSVVLHMTLGRSF